MITMSSGEAQNHFGALLDTAQREPVSITRRGRTVAYLLSPHVFETLTRQHPSVEGESLQAAARNAVAALQGSGQGGGASRLVADREAERVADR